MAVAEEDGVHVACGQLRRRRRRQHRIVPFVGAFVADASGHAAREGQAGVGGQEGAVERDRNAVAQDRAQAPVQAAGREAVAVVHEHASPFVHRLDTAVGEDDGAEFVGEVGAVPRVVVARVDDEPPPGVGPRRERAEETGRGTRHVVAVLDPRVEQVAGNRERIGVRVGVEQTDERRSIGAVVAAGTAEVQVGDEEVGHGGSGARGADGRRLRSDRRISPPLCRSRRPFTNPAGPSGVYTDVPLPPMRLHDRLHQERFASPVNEAILGVLVTASWLSGEIAQTLDAHGITPAQYNALRILRGSHPTRLACSAVGQRLIDRTPDVTRLLDRLEQAGLAERVRADHDRRVVLVGITDKGREVLDRTGPAMEALEARIHASMPTEDLRQLSDLLDRMRATEPEAPAP